MSLPVVAQPTSLAHVADTCATVEAWAEQCDDIPSLRDTANKLAAIDEYLSRTSTDGRARVAAAMRRLQQRIGQLIGPAQHGGDRRSDQVQHDELGLSPQERHDFRQMAAHPEVVDEVIKQSDDDSPPSRRKVMSAIRQRGNGSQVANNTGDVEWFTPAPYIEAARVLMGGIDLDPASTPEANEVVGATRFYTRADNGLIQPWGGRVWMNPPYSADLIRPFCEQLADAYTTGEVTEACALVNSATETGWFHTLAGVAAGICLPRGRIRFWHPTKASAIGPLQGQAIFYLGNQLPRFRDQFAQFGLTVVT